MKIVRLNSEPDKDGWFPIPENLTNRMMFCYPHLGEDDKWKSKETANRKINAIVSYWGEYFESKNMNWHIGLMGHDNIVIFDENMKEYDCYYRWYVYNGGRFIYKFSFEHEDEDWMFYNKNKDIYLRMEKIDKIINH